MPKTIINMPRLLLAKVRGGDFAHAGDKEAIEIVLDKIKQFPTNNIHTNNKALDGGCGLGGTANYFQYHTSYEVVGIDNDPAAIKHAKNKYPHLAFIEGDLFKIEEIFPTQYFSLIYLFNVFYALKAQQRHCLQQLARIAQPGAILVIFDYTHLDLRKSHGLCDLAGNPMWPIIPSLLRQWLTETGWEIIEETDLSPQFKQWYGDFLNKLEYRKAELLELFSQEAFDKVYAVFSQLLKQLNAKIIGGTAVYARRTQQLLPVFFSENKRSNPVSGLTPSITIKSRL